MVRLKGTQKRVKKLLKSISIPYGSIKRKLAVNADEDGVEFQFLMVRLKVFQQHFLGVACFISIPYGSIKSVLGIAVGSEFGLFQFLMVRLKDRHFSAMRHKYPDFNSLWFD